MTYLYWLLIGVPAVILATGVVNWWLGRIPTECEQCGSISDTLGTLCSRCRVGVCPVCERNLTPSGADYCQACDAVFGRIETAFAEWRQIEETLDEFDRARAPREDEKQ